MILSSLRIFLFIARVTVQWPRQSSVHNGREIFATCSSLIDVILLYLSEKEGVEERKRELRREGERESEKNDYLMMISAQLLPLLK